MDEGVARTVSNASSEAIRCRLYALLPLRERELRLLSILVRCDVVHLYQMGSGCASWEGFQRFASACFRLAAVLLGAGLRREDGFSVAVQAPAYFVRRLLRSRLRLSTSSRRASPSTMLRMVPLPQRAGGGFQGDIGGPPRLIRIAGVLPDPPRARSGRWQRVALDGGAAPGFVPAPPPCFAPRL